MFRRRFGPGKERREHAVHPPLETENRRDADTEKRLTQLARAIALSTHPPLPHYRDDDAYSGTTSDSVFPADATESTEPVPGGDETKDAGAPLDNDADDK